MLHNRWFALALLFLARTAMAIQFQSIGSVGPVLVKDLAIDYALLGTLIGLYMLPGIAVALPGGMLMQRFGAKWTALIGLALMSAGGAVMCVGSAYVPMAAGRLVSGAGAAFLNTSLTKIAADWFVGREIVTAMSLLITSWPLGIALGLIFFAPMAAIHGWQAAIYVATGLAFVCLVMLALMYRSPDAVRSEAPTLNVDLTRYEWRLVNLAGGIWATFNASYIILVSFAPDLFVARGYSLVGAGWVVSLVGWVLILSIPIGGFLADRSGRPAAFVIGGLAVMAVATVALPFVTVPVTTLIVIALAAGLPAGPALALPAQILRAESRAAGMGIFYTWYYAGMAVLPGIAGIARDLTGSANAPVFFSAAMAVAAIASLAIFLAAVRGGNPIRIRAP